MYREIDLERYLVKRVREKDGECLKLVLLNLIGFPDRTILMPNGCVAFVEVKRDRKQRLSAAQQQWKARLQQLGFRFFELREFNDVETILAHL